MAPGHKAFADLGALRFGLDLITNEIGGAAVRAEGALIDRCAALWAGAFEDLTAPSAVTFPLGKHVPARHEQVSSPDRHRQITGTLRVGTIAAHLFGALVCSLGGGQLLGIRRQQTQFGAELPNHLRIQRRLPPPLKHREGRLLTAHLPGQSTLAQVTLLARLADLTA